MLYLLNWKWKEAEYTITNYDPERVWQEYITDKAAAKQILTEQPTICMVCSLI